VKTWSNVVLAVLLAAALSGCGKIVKRATAKRTCVVTEPGQLVCKRVAK